MECRIVTTERVPTAVVKVEAPFARLPETQRAARATIAAALPTLDVGTVGRTCTRWRPPVDGALAMEIGAIVAREFSPGGDVVPSELPAGRAAHLSMKGPFEGLPAAWNTLFAWCKAQGLAPAGINWEIYGTTGDAELYALLA